MAAFLVRAEGLVRSSGRNLFIDDDDSIFELAIDRLGTAGITQGCNPPVNNRFCPDASVLRGQMAAFLTRALGLTPIIPPPPQPTPPACHPSYPDFCIPPPPPDLNCEDIPRNNFTVLSPDPHQLDGNEDGIGCEA
jgi:hypothetical protein